VLAKNNDSAKVITFQQNRTGIVSHR
jgi:hypothetical protein